MLLQLWGWIKREAMRGRLMKIDIKKMKGRARRMRVLETVVRALVFAVMTRLCSCGGRLERANIDGLVGIPSNKGEGSNY